MIFKKKHFALFLLTIYSIVLFGLPIQHQVCAFVSAANLKMNCDETHQLSKESCCQSVSEEKKSTTCHLPDTTKAKNNKAPIDCCEDKSVIIHQELPSIKPSTTFKVNLYQAIIKVFRFIVDAIFPSKSTLSACLPNVFHETKPLGTEQLPILGVFLI